MSERTPTDFLAISRISASDKLPAPGISRSITYSGIATSRPRYGSKYGAAPLKIRDIRSSPFNVEDIHGLLDCAEVHGFASRQRRIIRQVQSSGALHLPAERRTR